VSLSIDGFWKAGFWTQTFWADGFWYEGDPVAPPASTTVAGGGRKRKSRKYPRRAMVQGILYTVRSLEEEMALVQAMLDRAEYQDAVSVEASAAEPVKVLRRRLKKVASEREKWLAKLRQADEEILLLLH
jgi:hypothetical protein